MRQDQPKRPKANALEGLCRKCGGPAKNRGGFLCSTCLGVELRKLRQLAELSRLKEEMF